MDRIALQQRFAEGLLVFDGGFGTELYRKNFFVNTSYDALCINNPGAVSNIHSDYANAGADVLTTNTYNANAVNLAQFGLADKVVQINKAAVALARKGAIGYKNILVAGSIGPAVCRKKFRESLLEQIEALVSAGADFIIFESLSEIEELECVISINPILKDIAWMPSFVFDEHAQLADGSNFAELDHLLKKAENPPAAFGLNCGTGAETTLSALENIHSLIMIPIVVQPAAGTPKAVDNRLMPMMTPEYFTTYCMRYRSLGAAGVGGCCGITPDHIADMVRSLKPLSKGEKSVVPQLQIDVKEIMMEPVPLAEKSSFGKKLAGDEFIKLVELTPPAGFDLSATVEKAKLCKAAGFDAINLPDGPRASCRMSQIITALEIQKQAEIETIVHCCARDRNLISLQSMILGCMAENLRNILFITGDPPKLGDYPFTSGVFDVDSIGMVKMQSKLNSGIDLSGRPLGNKVQTAIVSGVGADPNAIDPEREYRRLGEKIEAGAEFIITQPVFDPDTLLKFLRKIAHFNIPVIAGVWPFASYRNAVFMKNEVPGVIVPEWIMKAMENAGDKDAQRAEGIRIARKILQEIHTEIRGVATSAPFGRVDTVIEVCDGF